MDENIGQNENKNCNENGIDQKRKKYCVVKEKG